MPFKDLQIQAAPAFKWLNVGIVDKDVNMAV